MKVSRGLLGLGLLVAGLLAVARTSEGAPSVVAMPAAAPLIGDGTAGQQTFTQYCSICHGVGAKGFIGPSIAGIDWTAPGLHAIVRGGLGGYGGMPAFHADAVTDKNIADIAAYLAALPPSSAPKSSTAPRTTAAATSPAAPSNVASAVAIGAPTPASSTSSATSSAIQPASSGAGDAARGRQVYGANCAACHGASAQGGLGPTLHGEKGRKDMAAAISWIKNPLPPMPKLYPSTLSEQDVDDVAAFVESL